MSPEDDSAKGSELVARAALLAPERAQVHWVQGLLLRRPKRYEEAAAAFEKAIALDRNFAPAYGSLGDLETILGRPAETIRLNEQAMRLSPRDPQLGNWQFDIGLAHFYLGDDEKAVSWLLRARASNPQLAIVPLLLAAIHGIQGRLGPGRAELAKAQQGLPWLTSIAAMRAVLPTTTDPIMLEREEQIYRAMAELGLPEG
jgi:adenylate cyclase